MKNFGYPYSDDYDEENTLDGDIHTLAIELEQLRRFSEIIYKMPDGDLKYDKKLKHNKSKRRILRVTMKKKKNIIIILLEISLLKMSVVR